MRLDVKAIALTCGILWGSCNLFCGLTAMSGWGAKWVEMMSSIYIGYSASLLGALIGGIWGFFDAGIGGALFGWLYNALARKN